MSDLAKLSRWVVPGAVLLFVFFAVLQLQRFWPPSVTSIQPPVPTGMGLAIAALSSLPLGALTYQMYFYQFSQPPLLPYVHRDIGLRVLLQARSAIDRAAYAQPSWDWRPYRTRVGVIWLKSKKTKGRLFLRRRGQTLNEYYSRRERNWVQVETLLARRTDRDSRFAAEELGRLSEIYHTLGATRLAMFYGLVGALAVGANLQAIGTETPSGYFTGSAVSVVIVLALGAVLHANRRHTLDRRCAYAVALLEQPAASSAQPSTSTP